MAEGSALQFHDDLDFQIADTYLLSKGWLTRLVNLTWCLFTLWLIIIDLFLEKGQLFQKRRVGSRKSMLWNTILLWYELCREAAVSFTYKKVVTCKHEVSQHNRTVSNCTKIPSVPHIESEKANLIFWHFFTLLISK